MPLGACGHAPAAPGATVAVADAAAPATGDTAAETADAADTAAPTGLAAEFAQMEADAAARDAAWTPERRAAAKALVATTHASPQAAIAAVLAGGHRAPANTARDGMRHPAETLAFFGVTPTQTVLEYGPGAGWYTELLAPLLAQQGRLVVTNGNPDGPRSERGTFYARRLQLFLDGAPELYGKVQQARIDDPKAPSLGLEAELDAALVIRGVHGWQRRGSTAAWLAEIHRALKPGGVLGVIAHRAPAGSDPDETTKQGYLPQPWVVAQVEAAGFKLEAQSELNANPADTSVHPAGVWTLPPTLRLGERDRAKYEAIGESDRMTLRFRKPAAP